MRVDPMRVLRKQLRKAILASVSAAALACGQTSPIGGSTGSGSTNSATSGSGASSSGTSGTGSSTSSGSSGSSGTCTCCLPAGLLNEVLVAPFDGGMADGGLIDTSLCEPLCDPNHAYPVWECSAVPADGGLWLMSCSWMSPCNGRRPAGLARASIRTRDALGAYLAHSAHLEAASIPAFQRLADELRAFDAPRALVRAAERAREDEVRHARTMSKLARAHGAAVPRVRHARFRPRSLLALARENAAEGCVRETFGAALALHQATHAGLPELRHAMKRIADDELQHAELAWEIDRWAQERLDAQARARVQAARRRAAASVRAEAARVLPDDLRTLAGLPDHSRARALVDALGLSLAWR